MTSKHFIIRPLKQNRTYLAHNIVAKNCIDWKNAKSIADIVVKIRWGSEK
jgi:hypothetical protein